MCPVKVHWFDLSVLASLILFIVTPVLYVRSFVKPSASRPIYHCSGWHIAISSDQGALRIGDQRGLQEWQLEYWKLLLLTLVLPVRWMQLRVVYVHRLRKRLCLKCGYDLRATIKRCPEC